MLNRFKHIFGNENEVVVCFGDFEQKKTYEIQRTNQR
jgi:hypothetical protein